MANETGHETSSGVCDIDHNSSLLIQMYLNTASPPHDGPELFDVPADQIAMNVNSSAFRIPGLLEEHRQHDNTDDTNFFDMTRDQVLQMPMLRVEQLRHRVQQLEVANFGLLKKIYGDQIDPNFLLSFSDANLLLELDFGSFQYRESLFEQYRKMMSLARHPELGGVVPSTPEGSQLLQQYMAQLVTLAQHQHDHLRVAGFSNYALLHRPHKTTEIKRQPFKIDKAGQRNQKRRVDSFDRGIRSPIYGNTALSDYQKQLAVLEQENQRRIADTSGDSPLFPRSVDFDLLGYDEQLQILKVRNEQRLKEARAQAIPRLENITDLDRPALYSEPSSASSIASSGRSSLPELSPPLTASKPSTKESLRIQIPRGGRKSKS